MFLTNLLILLLKHKDKVVFEDRAQIKSGDTRLINYATGFGYDITKRLLQSSKRLEGAKRCN